MRVFEGSLQVAASDYRQTVMKGDVFIEVEVDGLDDPFTGRSQLDFVLEYPFEKPYAGRVIGDAGITLRLVIDAVRKGFRHMYRGAAQEDIAGLHNKRVTGDYGEALHVIEDLVIELIHLDEASGAVEIGIGS